MVDQKHRQSPKYVGNAVVQEDRVPDRHKQPDQVVQVKHIHTRSMGKRIM